MFPPVSPPHTAKILCAYQGSVSNSEAGEELRMDFFKKNIKEKCTLKFLCVAALCTPGMGFWGFSRF